MISYQFTHGIFNIQLLFCAADSGLGLFFVNVFQSREISLFSCKKRHICIYVRLRDQKVNFTLQRHEVAWSKIEFCASKKFKAFLNRQLQKSKQTLSYWDIDNNPSPVSAAQNNSWILNMPCSEPFIASQSLSEPLKFFQSRSQNFGVFQSIW